MNPAVKAWVAVINAAAFLRARASEYGTDGLGFSLPNFCAIYGPTKIG